MFLPFNNLLKLGPEIYTLPLYWSYNLEYRFPILFAKAQCGCKFYSYQTGATSDSTCFKLSIDSELASAWLEGKLEPTGPPLRQN